MTACARKFDLKAMEYTDGGLHPADDGQSLGERCQTGWIVGVECASLSLS